MWLLLPFPFPEPAPPPPGALLLTSGNSLALIAAAATIDLSTISSGLWLYLHVAAAARVATSPPPPPCRHPANADADDNADDGGGRHKCGEHAGPEHTKLACTNPLEQVPLQSRGRMHLDAAGPGRGRLLGGLLQPAARCATKSLSRHLRLPLASKSTFSFIPPVPAPLLTSCFSW